MNAYGEYMTIAIKMLDDHIDKMKEAIKAGEPITDFDFKVSIGDETIIVPANGDSYAFLRSLFIKQFEVYGEADLTTSAFKN